MDEVEWWDQCQWVRIGGLGHWDDQSSGSECENESSSGSAVQNLHGPELIDEAIKAVSAVMNSTTIANKDACVAMEAINHSMNALKQQNDGQRLAAVVVDAAAAAAAAATQRDSDLVVEDDDYELKTFQTRHIGERKSTWPKPRREFDP